MKVTCSYCGAEFEVAEEVPIAVCPYCGTSIKVATREVVEEHYIFKVNYDYNSAYQKLIAVLSRELGIPKDFQTRASPTEGKLHFIPLYIYRVELYAVHDGRKISEEVEDVAALALREPPVPIPSGYKFPVRGRVYFSPSIAKKGAYYSPGFKPEELMKEVEKPIAERLTEEAELELGKDYTSLKEEAKTITLISKSRYVGLAHYPFWEIKYMYEGKEFKGYVDAADGTVVYAEYPKAFEKKVAVVSSGLIASAVAIGSLAPVIVFRKVSLALYGLVGALVAALPSIVTVLRRGIGEKGVYRFEVGKVGVTEEVR